MAKTVKFTPNQEFLHGHDRYETKVQAEASPALVAYFVLNGWADISDDDVVDVFGVDTTPEA